eukprot:CAMPEP_0115266262 /NCGR_PEP_ID=MMETSP0270-20121206/51376_1 /TAXON_ID=71861 /ORGANISM="Scrippsiella trochoidea, Strain CCMP3099" /LENGTH=132 /DNA_ID=CAMNT_0002682351 /DNA_START=99 /DNA_END=496 /DNA_ORIENTATION=+
MATDVVLSSCNQCTVLDVFDLQVSNSRDKAAALANDIGSQIIDIRALQRTKTLSCEMLSSEPDGLEDLMKTVTGGKDDRVTREQLSDFFASHHNRLLSFELDEIMGAVNKDNNGELDRSSVPEALQEAPSAR